MNTQKRRVIKKYPNRRLYDTSLSRYITLDNVRQLVLDEEDFVVLEVKTGKDLTRSILLQIISKQEQDEDDSSLLSINALSDLVRFYSESIQTATTRLMEQNIALLLQQQREVQQQISDAVNSSHPLYTFKQMAEKNMQLWEDMQNNFLAAVRKQDKKHENGT